VIDLAREREESLGEVVTKREAGSTESLPTFVFSGHQSFALRISWLPKAFGALQAGEDPFSDPRRGMALLGLGKNMVESLAFWVEATGVVTRDKDHRLEPTEFGRLVLCRKDGFGLRRHPPSSRCAERAVVTISLSGRWR
jgi:hypothetical protein